MTGATIWVWRGGLPGDLITQADLTLAGKILFIPRSDGLLHHTHTHTQLGYDWISVSPEKHIFHKYLRLSEFWLQEHHTAKWHKTLTDAI